MDRLRAAEAFLKEQAAGLEAALADKARALDQMHKQVAAAPSRLPRITYRFVWQYIHAHVHIIHPGSR